MNFIYDILVNLNEKEVYEFFEWDQKDNIEHIRRIPIFKISSKSLMDFKYNNIKIDKNFLLKIKNKTELFSNKFVDYIEYASIFTDGYDLIILEFSKNGECLLKSSMLLDEMEDTLSESEILNESDIKYEVIQKNKKNEFLTRKQKYIFEYIKKELNYLLKNKKNEKLKYLYYEWYNKKSENINYITNKLQDILKQEFSPKHISLFELIKLSNMKKQL